MELVLAKFLVLVVGYVAGIVLGVALHELGHALVALAGTHQRVRMELGMGGRRFGFSIGRLDCELATKGLRYGATHYDRESESRGLQIAVSLGGPLASLAAVVAFGWLATRALVGSWEWIAWLALCVASFRILIVSVWPMEHRPAEGRGAVWVSDGLDLWRLFRNGGR